ncbi:MAG: hypothetical protein B7Z73_16485 [Planctomycetia bacterium 21-64-5]|nr:MAG: hypothetical protein B7Z73_16485 [Planctomycetia bacterium 21-64-5]
MLTILLSVTTFMFFREYEEADQKAHKDAESATKASQQLREAVTEMEKLRKIIGVSDQAKLTEVEEAHREDMKNFATTVPDESKFYRPALEFLANTLKEKTAEIIVAREAIQREQDERKTVEAAKQTQVDEAQANAQKAEADLAAAKKAFDDERKQILEDQNDLKRQLAEKNDAMTELTEKSKKEIDEKVAENKKLDMANKYLNEKNLELDPTTGFEVPDGKIVWVDQKTRSAYINVGQADGLHRQTLFSVVAGDEDVGGDHQRTKGRIEVVELLGPHFAEARITEDRLTDPMVEGDKIFTPLWHPGRSEGFAIIGGIDLDNDGSDDREMVKDLIHMSGGTVDAEDAPDGKQLGKITQNTRYIIQGQAPDDSNVLGKAYTKLQKDALQVGVRLISVPKFLDQVGWKNQKQTLVFGRWHTAVSRYRRATSAVSSACVVRPAIAVWAAASRATPTPVRCRAKARMASRGWPSGRISRVAAR